MASPNPGPRNQLFEPDRRDFRSGLLKSESKAIRRRMQQWGLRSCTDIYARDPNSEEVSIPDTFIVPSGVSLRGSQVIQEPYNVESPNTRIVLSSSQNLASSPTWSDWIQTPALSPHAMAADRTAWDIKDNGARPKLGQSTHIPSEPLGVFCATCCHPLDFFGLCQVCLNAAFDFNEQPGGGICMK